MEQDLKLDLKKFNLGQNSNTYSLFYEFILEYFFCHSIK